jgi:cation diffusion facilitator CzcD-associated flavoprotein CzcO
MVPQFQATAKQLTVFLRNQTYIGPQIGSSISNMEADPDAKEPGAAGRHTYTEKEKQRFRDDPEYHLKYRRAIEKAVVGGFRAFYRGSQANLTAKETMQVTMSAKLSARPDLAKKFIPSWSPGCRRLTPGEGYLEALVSDNVVATFSDIVKITADGVLTVDGVEHKLDILACATGFHVQYTPHFTIKGTGDQTMQEQQPEVYASIAVPGYPNYFVVNGPRGNWGQGCALPSHDVQADYIIQCCRKMQEENIVSMQPKRHLTAQMNQYMDAWHAKYSVWAEDCRSWYKVRVVHKLI